MSTALAEMGTPEKHQPSPNEFKESLALLLTARTEVLVLMGVDYRESDADHNTDSANFSPDVSKNADC